MTGWKCWTLSGPRYASSGAPCGTSRPRLMQWSGARHRMLLASRCRPKLEQILFIPGHIQRR